MNTVAEAMQAIGRQDFLPNDVRKKWNEDVPLSIGYGRTDISPSVTMQMLRWLDIEPGQRVLVISSGDGWTTALASRLAGPEGRVYATEDNPELLKMGQKNCHRAGCVNVSFQSAGIDAGLPANAPYDRILVGDGVEEFPFELLEQMETPGKMIVPVNLAIYEVYKGVTGHVERFAHYGYIFIPQVDYRGIALRSSYQN